MKVIHEIGFTANEVEYYRQQVFMNLWDAMRSCLEGMQELSLRLEVPENRVRCFFSQKRSRLTGSIHQNHLYLFENQPTLTEGQPYPEEYHRPMQELWADPGVQTMIKRSSEAILPDSTV